MNFKALTIAAMTVLIGGGIYCYKSSEQPPAAPVTKKIEQPAHTFSVGIIDIEKIQAAHPEGATLDDLRATELRLRLEFNEAMRTVELPKPPPPETNTEVFDEAAWQKNAQIIISQLAELETRKKVAAEEYRKNSEPQYIAERDRIRGEFLNENLNIQLKLQNADNLHLTDEQVKKLQEDLDAVEFGRNLAQKELLDKWMAEIEKYAEDSVAADEARLKAEAEKLRAEVEEQARKKADDVTDRNKKLMEDAVREMENRQHRRQQIFDELTEVGKERAALEKKILDSIVDKTTMLAAVTRLDMVFVKRSPVPSDKILRRGTLQNFELKPPESVGAIIIPGKDARDLTDDVIKEMNRL